MRGCVRSTLGAVASWELVVAPTLGAGWVPTLEAGWEFIIALSFLMMLMCSSFLRVGIDTVAFKILANSPAAANVLSRSVIVGTLQCAGNNFVALAIRMPRVLSI